MPKHTFIVNHFMQNLGFSPSFLPLSFLLSLCLFSLSLSLSFPLPSFLSHSLPLPHLNLVWIHHLRKLHTFFSFSFLRMEQVLRDIYEAV